MKPIMRLAAVAVCGLATMPAHADHHGRGREQLNGFPGIYNVGPGRVTFTDDGYAIIVNQSSNVAISVMTYAISDGVMTLRDVSPPAFLPAAVRSCLRENAATYAMIDQENGFSLEVRNDPCPPRARLFDQMRLTDYVRPDPQ